MYFVCLYVRNCPLSLWAVSFSIEENVKIYLCSFPEDVFCFVLFFLAALNEFYLTGQREQIALWIVKVADLYLNVPKTTDFRGSD